MSVTADQSMASQITDLDTPVTWAVICGV